MSLQTPQLPSLTTPQNSRTPLSPSARRRLINTSIALTAILGVFALVLTLRLYDQLRKVDFIIYDNLIRYRNAHPDHSWDTPVVLVRVTEDDIQDTLESYPVSDLKMAELLEKLIAGQPAAIGVDIFRDIPAPQYGSNLSFDDQHAVLGKVLQDNSNIVFITYVGRSGVRTIQAPSALRGDDYASQRGFNNHADDPDGRIRRALLSLTDENGAHVAFGMWLTLNYLATRDISPEPRPSPDAPLQLSKAAFPIFTGTEGDYVRADARGEQILMDYRGPREFPSVTLTDVLTGRVPASRFKDKVILIGVTTLSVKDFSATPLNPLTWGVEIHAHTVDQLLRGALLGHQPTRSWSNFAEALWILLWTILGALAGLYARRPVSFSVIAAVGVALISLIVWQSFMHGLWIPSVEPALAWCIAAGIVAPAVSQQERAERAMLMQIFEQFQSKDVAELLWKQRDALLEGGRVKPLGIEATVLFTDLAGFSTVSEKMPPATLMDWLSDYLGIMAKNVEDHGGMVNKYIGDAVMAVFGAPLPSLTPEEIRKDALDAVSTALDMRQKLAEANQRWASQGLPQVQMRVGIMSGHLVAGVLASGRREYTVIGDVVNTAARLESYDKDLMDPDIASDGCRILIGGPTYELVKKHFQTRFVAFDEVKGKSQKVEIHGVISRADKLPSPPGRGRGEGV